MAPPLFSSFFSSPLFTGSFHKTLTNCQISMSFPPLKRKLRRRCATVHPLQHCPEDFLEVEPSMIENQSFMPSRNHVLRRRNWVFSLKSGFRASLCFLCWKYGFCFIVWYLRIWFCWKFSEFQKNPPRPIKSARTLLTCSRTARFSPKICGSRVLKIQPTGLRGGGKKGGKPPCPVSCPPLSKAHTQERVWLDLRSMAQTVKLDDAPWPNPEGTSIHRRRPITRRLGAITQLATQTWEHHPRIPSHTQNIHCRMPSRFPHVALAILTTWKEKRTYPDRC
jgi:hypothetical protein